MEHAAVRLAENVALLQAICCTPVPPTSNTISGDEIDTGRRLSLADEAEIAESLTYLSTYSSNPGDVLALCIEEQANRLLISVATNSGPTVRLESGIKRLLEILREEATGVVFHRNAWNDH
jgi:hypothetical protein